MEITKREILASITIIAVMLIIGVLIGGSISDSVADRNEAYYKAVKIDDSELFKYGMSTNIGNAFVYGDMEILDPVTYPEIGGEYAFVEKVKEKYTMHTRTTTTRVNGKTLTRTRVYWTWDVVNRESISATEVKFLDVNFKFSQFNTPSAEYLKTIKESSHIRYKYYVVPKNMTGTIFVKLYDGDIGTDVELHRDSNIKETLDSLVFLDWSIFFWGLWLLVIGGVVYGFYYLDNDWLEDKKANKIMKSR